MNFELSEDQRAFQSLAAGFAREQMAPHAQAWDEKLIFPVVSERALIGR